jgi:hypothetical protein
MACLVAAVATASRVKAAETVEPIASIMGKVAALEAELAHMKERQKISDLYVRFTRGFDRQDAELIRSVFWEDAQIYYGTESNRRDDFIATHLPRHTPMGGYAHHITSQTVEITGEVAHVESNLIALFRDKNDEWASVQGFRYIDRLDRRNGEWRVSVREAIPHFYLRGESHFDTLADLYWRPEGCWLGTRDKRDPSYRRPLTPRVNQGDGPTCARSP